MWVSVMTNQIQLCSNFVPVDPPFVLPYYALSKNVECLLVSIIDYFVPIFFGVSEMRKPRFSRKPAKTYENNSVYAKHPTAFRALCYLRNVFKKNIY